MRTRRASCPSTACSRIGSGSRTSTRPSTGSRPARPCGRPWSSRRNATPARATPPLVSPGTTLSLERLVATDAHEGPVYAPDEHALYFTSVPAPRAAIRRFDLSTRRVTTLVDDGNAPNGMSLAADGRLLVCEQDPPAIALIDRRSGEREPVVEDAGLNSPNDVVEKSDGSIWFTDPSYGYLQGFRPPP